MRTLFLSAAFVFIGSLAIPAEAAPNSCQSFQGSKSVSGPLVSLSYGTGNGIGNCAEACTAYAAQTGANVNCQTATNYVANPPVWMCFPTPMGEMCDWYSGGGSYVTSCSAGTGSIVNNSSSYSAASCTVPPPAPTVSITANPSTVQNGGTTVISWNATNASSCNYTSNGATSGNQAETVSVGTQSSKTYSITCTNSAGESTSDSVTVNVSNPNTPASCTPWDSTITPATAAAVITVYTPTGSELYYSGSGNVTPTDCMNACKAASDLNGGAYTCGGVWTSSMYALGGTSYGGVGVSQTSGSACYIAPGTTTGPAIGRTYQSCRASGGIFEKEMTYSYNNWTTVIDTITPNQHTVSSQCSYDPLYGGGVAFEAVQSSWMAAGATTCTSATTGSPDLVATSVLPATATAGQPITLSSTIANVGTASTGIGFTNVFQVANDASGTGAQPLGTHANGVLAGGLSNAAILSHTFAAVGTYYVRACADSSSVIVEGNELNNCTPWTAVAVTSSSSLCTAPSSTFIMPAGNPTTSCPSIGYDQMIGTRYAAITAGYGQAVEEWESSGSTTVPGLCAVIKNGTPYIVETVFKPSVCTAPPTPTLKVCQNSCAGIQRGNVNSTQSFVLARGAAENLVACFNSSNGCEDSSGTGNVTASTSWGENGGSNIVSLSGSNPKTVSANNAGTEGISATYGGQTANMNITVTCVQSVTCDNAPGRENYCQNESFNVDNGCGVSIPCPGTKTCNYNWKEVAP